MQGDRFQRHGLGRRIPHQHGFTITELAVTLAVVGVVSSIAFAVAGTDRSVVTAEDGIAGISRLHQFRSRAVTGDGDYNAAIAAGLPPDARGTIDLEARACNANIAVCADGGDTFMALVSKRLRANGQLEPVSEVQFPYNSNGPYLTWNANHRFWALIPDDWFFCDEWGGSYTEAFFETEFTSIGDKNGVFRVICYANGTCDPVTYVAQVVSGEGGAGEMLGGFLIVSVTSTGSVTTKQVSPKTCATRH